MDISIFLNKENVFLLVLFFLLVLVVAYILGYIVTKIIDQRLGQIKVNIPRPNVIVNMEKMTNKDDLASSQSTSTSHDEKDKTHEGNKYEMQNEVSNKERVPPPKAMEKIRPDLTEQIVKINSVKEELTKANNSVTSYGSNYVDVDKKFSRAIPPFVTNSDQDIYEHSLDHKGNESIGTQSEPEFYQNKTPTIKNEAILELPNPRYIGSTIQPPTAYKIGRKIYKINNGFEPYDPYFKN